MGQARRKLMEASKLVVFDFNKPEFMLLKGDRESLAKNPDGTTSPDQVSHRALVAVVQAVVQAAFPAGMDRRDGKLWAAWQEILGEDQVRVRLPMTQVEWLKKHVSNDDLKLQPALAQWRESLADYLETIKPDEGKTDEAKGAS